MFWVQKSSILYLRHDQETATLALKTLKLTVLEAKPCAY